MNIYKSFLLTSILFISLSLQAAVETIHFNILLFGDKIGTLTVSHELKADGKELYTLETNSKTKLLWIEKENYSHYDVLYKDGKLLTSSHKEIENKKLKRWTNINWDGKLYQVDSYKGKRSFSEAPTFCVLAIYFKDPKELKRIFYEAEADYAPVSHPQPNTWEFKSSDGTRNIYNFDNGKIKSMEFHISVATVKMVRID